MSGQPCILDGRTTHRALVRSYRPASATERSESEAATFIHYASAADSQTATSRTSAHRHIPFCVRRGLRAHARVGQLHPVRRQRRDGLFHAVNFVTPLMSRSVTLPAMPPLLARIHRRLLQVGLSLPLPRLLQRPLIARRTHDIRRRAARGGWGAFRN